jgi:adenine phosphoribosyltransferase
MDFNQYIRKIPDFPKPGILYYDITTLLSDAKVFGCAIENIVAQYKNMGITKVIGIESRGFIIGSVAAYAMNVGFVPVRKKGKLPYKTYSVEYDLEYGSDVIEMHQDALQSADKVLIIDDMLATGGTAKAVLELVQKFGISEQNVFLCFLMDIAEVQSTTKAALQKHGYFALI